MAVAAATQVDNPIQRQTTITWASMADADTGAGVLIGDLDDIAVQSFGDATAMVWQGSQDGTNWGALGSGLSQTITSTISPVDAVTVKAKYVRPNPTGGSASTAILTGTRRK